jgi:hypothetical protein
LTKNVNVYNIVTVRRYEMYKIIDNMGREMNINGKFVDFAYDELAYFESKEEAEQEASEIKGARVVPENKY